MTNNAKWEQLLEYIVNDESDKAKELFHEIVVAESRSIYADILESEVEESMDDMEEATDGNEVESFIDEVEAEESGDSTVEDASDDVEDSMSADDDSGEDMGDDDMGGDDMGDDMGDEEGEEGEEMEDRVADLENALDELKAEFDELMSQEQNEPEHADMGMGGDDMGMDSDEGEMDMSSSDDMGDEMDEMSLAEGVEMSKVPAVSNTEGADSSAKKSPLIGKLADFGGKSVKFDQGGDEKGGKVSAPTQHMGQAKYANSAGQKNVKMETAPKAQTKEPAGVMAKPILSK